MQRDLHLGEKLMAAFPYPQPWRAFACSTVATGDLYDAFYLDKSETAEKQLTNGEVVDTATRRFETTGPYRDKSSLR